MKEKITESFDPLPSWNEGEAKRAIFDFVARVTENGGKDFVPEVERIATFDNDGTLWSEQPFMIQGVFVSDLIKRLAPQHPEWRTLQPFKAILEGDMKTLASLGEKALLELVMVSHAGNTTEEFRAIVQDWIDKAKHPRFQRLYPQIVFQPMIELLSYLRTNGFKTFIVSGGGVEFMRPWAEKTYGIPPEQVIGSSIVTQFAIRDGKPVLVRVPQLNFFDDQAGKPVAINQHIGRRPIAAFGNSDGDLPMLQWTAAGAGLRFCLLVQHTDAEREWAYRYSLLGKLDAALKEAKARNWSIVDMKADWKRIFPFEAERTASRVNDSRSVA